MIRVLAKSVDCPTCGAQRNEPCFSLRAFSHATRKAPHPARLELARQVSAQ